MAGKSNKKSKPGGNGAPSAGDDFLDETVSFWQARSKRILTREDARDMISNVAGFIGLLARWDAQKRRSAS